MCWSRQQLRPKCCHGLNRWDEPEKNRETGGHRAGQVLCGHTKCLLSAFQQCQDLGALSTDPYLSQLNYWCVSSDVWAERGRGGEEKVGTWLEVAWDHMVMSWWVSVWLCAKIWGYPKLVVVVVCIEGWGRVKLWAAGSLGHIFQGVSGWSPVAFVKGDCPPAHSLSTSLTTWLDRADSSGGRVADSKPHFRMETKPNTFQRFTWGGLKNWKEGNKIHCHGLSSTVTGPQSHWRFMGGL